VSESVAYRALRPLGRRAKAAGRAFIDPPHVPPGHYHSPLQGRSERSDFASQQRVADIVDSIPGVDMRAEPQLNLLRKMSVHAENFPWAKTSTDGVDLRYFYDNEWYHQGDASVYAAMLIEFRPRQVIEVGSGFSSALLLDVDEHFLDGSTSITFIEPYPERLRSLVSDSDLANRLTETNLQDIPLERFRALGENDVLFIDSTHVSRPGSDVNYLFFEVLPSLRPGVLVHLHDIHWPFEYPPEWIESAWGWTETYLVRSFLQYNESFQIEFMNSYLRDVHPRNVGQYLPLMAEAGPSPSGSLWIRRV